MKAEMRAMAHDLAKDSIVTDALAQFIAQVIEELHKTKIAPAEARALAAEAERDALREALAPFGRAAGFYALQCVTDDAQVIIEVKPGLSGALEVGDFRRARALTQETNDVGEADATLQQLRLLGRRHVG